MLIKSTARSQVQEEGFMVTLNQCTRSRNLNNYFKRTTFMFKYFFRTSATYTWLTIDILMLFINQYVQPLRITTIRKCQLNVKNKFYFDMTETGLWVLLHYTIHSFHQLELSGSLQQLDLRSLNQFPQGTVVSKN